MQLKLETDSERVCCLKPYILNPELNTRNLLLERVVQLKQQIDSERVRRLYCSNPLKLHQRRAARC